MSGEVPATKPRHTPGPWKYVHSGSVRLAVREGDEFRNEDFPAHVVRIYQDDQGRRCTQFVAVCNGANVDNDANAEFLASAPLLEERVEALMETLQTIADFAVGNGDVCEIIARRARAALAEAERALGQRK